jgi:hypothetical protein
MLDSNSALQKSSQEPNCCLKQHRQRSAQDDHCQARVERETSTILIFIIIAIAIAIVVVVVVVVIVAVVIVVVGWVVVWRRVVVIIIVVVVIREGVIIIIIFRVIIVISEKIVVIIIVITATTQVASSRRQAGSASLTVRGQWRIAALGVGWDTSWYAEKSAYARFEAKEGPRGRRLTNAAFGLVRRTLYSHGDVRVAVEAIHAAGVLGGASLACLAVDTDNDIAAHGIHGNANIGA